VATIVEAYLIGGYRPSRHGSSADDEAAIAVAVGVLATAQVPRVLDSGIAVDIPFTPGGADDKAITARLRGALHDKPFDVVVQPAAGRRKRLFIADMDSTMIGQECIDELADYVDLKTRVAAITESAMRGETAFEPALHERVALLKGLPPAVVDDVITKRITLTPGGRTLAQTMRRNGCNAATNTALSCGTNWRTRPNAAGAKA
jgi:phosphoserine phosphatase